MGRAPLLLLLLSIPAARTASAEAEDALDPLYRRAAEDLRKGRPLVATIHVALCDNTQLHCGGHGLGDGDRPGRNLYWGGGAGLRAVFDRARGWRRIHRDGGDGEQIVERVVYRHAVEIPSRRWQRLGVTGPFELLAVALAYRGSAIGVAHHRLFDDLSARKGLELELRGGAVRAGGLGHLVGYAGHNHLLDAFDFAYPRVRRREPLAYFALSCLNGEYYAPRTCGSPVRALLVTRTLMYPGAPPIEAMLRAFARAAPQEEVYSGGVEAYAKMQKRPVPVIRHVFVHDGEKRFSKLYPGCRPADRTSARGAPAPAPSSPAP